MNAIKKIYKYLINLNYLPLIVLFNLFVIFSILIFSVFLYKSDTVMFKAVDLFDEKTQYAVQLGEKRNILMKFFEEFDLFSSKAINIGLLPEVAVIDIKLDKNNIDYINNVIERSLDQSSNVYSLGPFISTYDNDFVEDTETKILFNGKEFNAKIKLHGVGEDNWINPKKSFSIKTSKNDYINNTRRFKLIVFEEQFLQTILAYKLTGFMGYMDVGTEIVKLRLNGIDQGYYLLEEALSKDLLEKNNLSGVDKLTAISEWTHQYLSGHLTLFSHEVSNQEFDNYSGKDVGQLLLFKNLIEAKNYEDLEGIVDLDRFAIHEAMRIIFASSHAVSGDNIKWLYDTTNGKFFPYFRMEGYLNALTSTERSHTFDKDLNEWFWFNYDIKVFPILNRNNEFRALRNKYLYKILNERENFEIFYSNLFDKYGLIPNIDKTNNLSSRFYINKIKETINNLSNNFDYIDKYLNYSRVYTTLNQINNKEVILEIVPDSNSTVQIDEFKINGIKKDTVFEITNLMENKSNFELSTLEDYFEDKHFSLSLDESFEVEKNIYKYKIKSINNFDIKNYEISFINSITRKPVIERETYKKFIKTPEKLYINNKFDFESLIIKYPLITVQDKKIIFNKGTYFIDEDIEIPEAYDVEILAGSELLLSKNISVLIRGNLNILGTKSQIVKVTNANPNEPFGVFAAVGNGKTVVDISGLEINGGNEDFISGVYLSGALSLYHHQKVILVDSIIYNNYADDGLNIKNSNVFLKDNFFSSNYADQVDLDFVNGIILNNNFKAKSNDIFPSASVESINGDGLDLSGSMVVIKNNTYTDFPDKGISVGEKSDALIIDNKFNKNRSAISIKDESEVFIYKNQYNSNEIDIELYQKKQIFNEPSVFNLNNTNVNFQIDKSLTSNFYNASSKLNVKMISVIQESTDPEIVFSLLKEINWTKDK